MAQKAQDYINQSKTNLSAAASCLQQALGAAEKAENKSVIQQAINSLNSATGELDKYKD